MRLLFLALFIPFFVQSQVVTINAPGLPSTVTLNTPGLPSTITINDPKPVDYQGSVNLNQQDLTAGQNFYHGWPMSYATGIKRGVVFRRGTIHTRSQSDMVQYVTSEGGNTWMSNVIHSETGVDIRNYGGGNTSDGTILIFFGRWLANDTWTARCLRSTNGGSSYVQSTDLPLYTPGSFVSPYGPIMEFEDGTLVQAFYSGNAGGTIYIWTLKSTDKGITWETPTLICSGPAMFEPSLVYLGNGKIIAAIRNDVGVTDKDLIIWNSDDHGVTYDSIGKGLFGGFDIPGTSPLLFKKDVNTAYVVATNRQEHNNFIQTELPFGNNETTGMIRFFYDGRPQISGSNIDFGYPVPIKFRENDIDSYLAGFYDASPTWVSGDPITDVMIYPIFQQKYFISQRTSGTMATGTGTYTPSVFIVDEMSCANTPNSQNLIREAGSYDIRVEAEFSGSGTSREIRVQRYNSSGVFVETMHTTGASSSNSYDFTTTQTMGVNERILINVVHDANPLTINLIRLHITKQ